MDTTAAEYVAQRMPTVGIGTFQMRNEATLFKVIKKGIEIGYRMIDTAQCYGNERKIGDSIQRLLNPDSPDYDKLSRSELFITSKVSPANQGKDKVEHSIRRSLANLQTEYLDLVLIHWPGTSKYDIRDPKNKELRRETWLELERLYKEGLVRSIGVSNYEILHLTELLEDYATVLPSVNQCEFHPFYANSTLLDFCKERGIQFQAYSSFGSPDGVHDLFSDPAIQEIAKKHNISVAEFLLAWALQQKVCVLPRTGNLEHLETNWRSQNVILSSEEIDYVRQKDSNMKKYCWNPSSVV